MSPSGTEAILQRFAPVQGGYPIAVRLAAHQPVDDWYAELILPAGASITGGPGTTVTQQKVGYRLVPARPQITPAPGRPGMGVVYAAVVRSDSAPTHVRVWAKTPGGAGYAPIAGVYVTSSRGRLVQATDAAWPGSASVQTDPTKWTDGGGDGGAGFGGGFGFGGGGGGGGQHQTNLTIEVDDNGRLRKILHTVDSDSGGGGGAGGGGGMGGGTGGAQDYAQQGQLHAESGQQQGNQQEHAGQQQDHGGGNPLTRLEKIVNDNTKRLEALESRPR